MEQGYPHKNLKYDSKGIPIKPKKFEACEQYVRVAENKIFNLKQEIRSLDTASVATDPFVMAFLVSKGFNYEAEKSKITQLIREKEREIAKLKREVEARKKCWVVNSGFYEYACEKCKGPDTPDHVKQININK